MASDGGQPAQRIAAAVAGELVEAMRTHPAEAPPHMLLRLIIDDIARLVERRPDDVAVYLGAIRGNREVEELQTELLGYVSGVIDRGIESGQFRPVDSAVAALGLMGMVSSMHQWFEPGGRYTVGDLVEIWSDLTLAAYSADSGGPGAVRPPKPRRSRGSRP